MRRALSVERFDTGTSNENRVACRHFSRAIDTACVDQVSNPSLERYGPGPKIAPVVLKSGPIAPIRRVRRGEVGSDRIAIQLGFRRIRTRIKTQQIHQRRLPEGCGPGVNTSPNS